MALVTVRAVVHIPVHFRVIEVVSVVAAMTARTCEHGIIVRIRVARGANAVRVAMRRWELCVLLVIERRAGPGSRVMAVLTGRREELRLRLVTRIRRVVVIGLMAADALRGQRSVIAIHMAIDTLARRHGVRASQGEGCVVMVERRICPRRGVVAEFAGSRVSGGCVRRIGRAVVVLLVARVTQRAVQAVIVIDVAIGTEPRWHGVRARQLEAGSGVVEGAVGPMNRVVASFTGCRKCCRDVIHRRLGGVVIGLMAGYASRAGQVVVVVDVAVGTRPRRHRMRTRQRETGCAVIERRTLPRRRAVALLAGLREIRRDVIGVRRSLVVRQVTGHAGGTGQVVVVVDVTVNTRPRRYGMRTGQREAGG